MQGTPGAVFAHHLAVMRFLFTELVRKHLVKQESDQKPGPTFSCQHSWLQAQSAQASSSSAAEWQRGE